MNKKTIFILMISIIFILRVSALDKIGNVNDIDNILPLRKQAEITNKWLKWRLDNILPDIMKKEDIDMWVIICREYNEDPVYLTMVPKPTMSARRKSILIFFNEEKGKGVKRYTGSFYGMGKWYSSIYKDKTKNQMKNLAEFIKEKNPRKIGLNYSLNWAFGDGLSATFRSEFTKIIGKKLSTRIVSAENLCIRWLETRSPQELNVYRHICGVAHDIIKEAFSNKVIIPDVTTTLDVKWWFRQKFSNIGVRAWFQPSVSIQRSKTDQKKYRDKNFVIRRGDILHCDIGIVYMGLCTDTQQHAYVCRTGETDVPEGLKKALKQGNRLQNILLKNFKKGWSGNKILKETLKQAKTEKLNSQIYTHPLGFHGHAAGPTIGLWNNQNEIPVRGDYRLNYNTCYAIELNIKYDLPEWKGQNIRIGLEEDGMFTKNGCHFIDGRQIEFYIIK